MVTFSPKLIEEDEKLHSFKYGQSLLKYFVTELLLTVTLSFPPELFARVTSLSQISSELLPSFNVSKINSSFGL